MVIFQSKTQVCMVNVRDALFQETDWNAGQGILILLVTATIRKKILDQFLMGPYLSSPAVSPSAVWLCVSLERYNMAIAVCFQSATQTSHCPYRLPNKPKWVSTLPLTSRHRGLHNSCQKGRVVTSVLVECEDTWDITPVTSCQKSLIQM